MMTVFQQWNDTNQLFNYTILSSKFIGISIYPSLKPLLKLLIFGSINLIQEQLLINVKHQMTYTYFQYSCFGLNLFHNIFYPMYIIHILWHIITRWWRGWMKCSHWIWLYNKAVHVCFPLYLNLLCHFLYYFKMVCLIRHKKKFDKKNTKHRAYLLLSEQTCWTCLSVFSNRPKMGRHIYLCYIFFFLKWLR